MSQSPSSRTKAPAKPDPDAPAVGGRTSASRGSALSDAPAGQRLAQLRRFRGRRAVDPGIHAIVEGFRREAGRQRRQSGSFVEAWERVIPDRLRTATRIRRVQGGVARVGVRDAATRYELDQGLRSGWLAELRLACGQPIRQVRLEADASLENSRNDESSRTA